MYVLCYGPIYYVFGRFTASMDKEHSFSLCLTHDVDRPYKTHQSLFYAIKDRDPKHLRTLLPGINPYWQFEEVMKLEEDLDVRSAFYFLNEQNLFRDRPPREWMRLESWKLYSGRYSIFDPKIVDIIRKLDVGGWEVGLHGSYESFQSKSRLQYEKETLEEILGHSILGGRQHYLNLEKPDTWRHHADIGLKYDSSLGSATDCGFQYGYDIKRPFDDEFVVFPLTLMENALPDPGENFEKAWDVCRRLLDEAAANDATMTILWHINKFSEQEYPGYRRIYRRIIEYAKKLNAWIGPPAQRYKQLQHSTKPRQVSE